MIEQNNNKFLIIVLGPTAVGKTLMGVRLAKHFNAEVISADSRQFYRGMHIGTAVPKQTEMEGIPHHFIGSLSLKDYYNVSMFEKQVVQLLGSIYEKNNFAVMVGGSGLYIDAVCHGIDDFPDVNIKTREFLKKEMSDKGLEALLIKLKELDPEYYDLVDRKNPNRILRALEVCIATGQKYSGQRTKPAGNRDFSIIKIGLNTDRKILFDRIGKRVDEMMESDLVEEAKRLLPYRNLNALNTVGYKELFDHFDGKCSLEEAIEKIKTNTRRYAKRQLTWFKRDADIKWFEPGELTEVVEWIEHNQRSKNKQSAIED